MDFFSPSPGKSLTYKWLAFSSLSEDSRMIKIGGINKIDAMFYSIMKQPGCFWIVNFFRFMVNSREPHTSKSENRQINPCFTKFPVEHKLSCLLYTSDAAD